MTMKKIIIIALSCLASMPSWGQYSTLQDNKGVGSAISQATDTDPDEEGAMPLAIRINASDESFLVGFMQDGISKRRYNGYTKQRHAFTGASFKLRSVDGVSALLKGTEFNPEIKFGLIIGGTRYTNPRETPGQIAPTFFAMFNVEYSRFNL